METSQSNPKAKPDSATTMIHNLKSAQKLSLVTIIWFCLILPNQALADKNAKQFNFDESYQGDAPESKSDQSIYDPFEKTNRQIFAFNEFLDKNITVPALKKYRQYTPKPIRNSAHNFVKNIYAPFSMLNSMLQGEGTESMATFSSFLINTTLGVGGLFDVAGDRKISYKENDFGQTLGKYGSKPGAYLVIPILGPSNIRDFSGFAVEKIVSPLSLNGLDIGGKDLIDIKTVIALDLMRSADARDGLIEIVDDLRKNSFDVYATMRSAYSQRRASLISNKI